MITSSKRWELERHAGLDARHLVPGNQVNVFRIGAFQFPGIQNRTWGVQRADGMKPSSITFQSKKSPCKTRQTRGLMLLLVLVLVISAGVGEFVVSPDWDLRLVANDQLVTDAPEGPWANATYPCARYGTQIVNVQGTTDLFMFGGFGAGDYQSDAWLYHSSTDLWEKVSSGPNPIKRYGHGMLSPVDDVILMYGGRNTIHRNDVYRWSVSGGWSLRFANQVPNGDEGPKIQAHAMWPVQHGGAKANGFYSCFGSDGSGFSCDTLYHFEDSAWKPVLKPAFDPGDMSGLASWADYAKGNENLWYFGYVSFGYLNLTNASWNVLNTTTGVNSVYAGPPPVHPGQRSQAGVAVDPDPETQLVYLFGGNGLDDVGGSGRLGDLWSLDLSLADSAMAKFAGWTFHQLESQDTAGANTVGPDFGASTPDSMTPGQRKQLAMAFCDGDLYVFGGSRMAASDVPAGVSPTNAGNAADFWVLLSDYQCEDGQYQLSETTCNGHGSCNKTDPTCVCTGRFGGSLCADYTCEDGNWQVAGVTCNNHGNCNETDPTCVCDGIWEGTYCDDHLCEDGNWQFGGITCNNHGNCNGTDATCVCDGIWEGTYCDDYLCEDGNSQVHNTTCNGNGDCDDENPTCVCDNNWGGTHCDTCDPARWKNDNGLCNTAKGWTFDSLPLYAQIAIAAGSAGCFVLVVVGLVVLIVVVVACAKCRGGGNKGTGVGVSDVEVEVEEVKRPHEVPESSVVEKVLGQKVEPKPPSDDDKDEASKKSSSSSSSSSDSSESSSSAASTSDE